MLEWLERIGELYNRNKERLAVKEKGAACQKLGAPDAQTKEWEKGFPTKFAEEARFGLT